MNYPLYAKTTHTRALSRTIEGQQTVFHHAIKQACVWYECLNVKMNILSTVLLLTLLRFSSAALVVPGAAWTDTSGNLIQAHGGGFLKVSAMFLFIGQNSYYSQVGSTYYWHGEDKSANSALFKAVSCYSVNIFLQVPTCRHSWFPEHRLGELDAPERCLDPGIWHGHFHFQHSRKAQRFVVTPRQSPFR